MKNLVLLVLLGVLGAGGYFYLTSAKDGLAVKVVAPSEAAPKAASEAKPKTAAAKDANAAAPASQLVKCARCGGTGLVKCPNPTCKEGTVECNGPCLRLTKGEWVKMEVAGHPPTDVWQVFRYKTNSRSGYQAWNQAHVGQVIEMVDGMPTNVGDCKICHGTTRVPCPTCQGKAEVVCPVCHGAKMLAPAKAPGAPVAAAKPAASAAPAVLAPSVDEVPPPATQTFRLKNGKTVIGQVVIQDATVLVIRTPDGKSVQVAHKDLLDSH